MKYSLVLQGKNSYEVLDTKDTMELANKRLEKLSKKLKRTDIKIIGVPEVGAGSKLYRNGRYYATVVNESKDILFINNTENPMFYDDCILKTNIEKYFYLGKFDEGIESIDEDYMNNLCIDDYNEDFNNEDTENTI
jgi:hypothetical protein